MDCPKKERCKNYTAECEEMHKFGDTFFCFERNKSNLYEYRREWVKRTRAKKKEQKEQKKWTQQ